MTDGIELFLKVYLRSSEYIHSAEKAQLGKFREINCSLESTSWMLHIFRHSMDVVNSSILKTFEIVTLHDPETKSNVSIALANDDVDDDGTAIVSHVESQEKAAT